MFYKYVVGKNIRYVILLILAVFFVFITSCNKMTVQTFQYPEEDPYCSFQYPNDYRVSGSLVSSGNFVIEISDKKDIFAPSIHIEASENSMEPKSISEIVDTRVYHLSEQENFKILQKGSIFFDDVESMYVAYSYSFIIDGNVYEAIEKYIIFEKHGRTWVILAMSDLDKLEKFEAVFARLIYSLKIFE